MLPDPKASALSVLEPLDMHVILFFHEFRVKFIGLNIVTSLYLTYLLQNPTVLKPQLEFYMQLSDFSAQINKHQYEFIHC